MQFQILAIVAALASSTSAYYNATGTGYWPTGTGYPTGTGVVPTSTYPAYTGAAVPNSQVAGSAMGFVVAAGFALVI